MGMGEADVGRYVGEAGSSIFKKRRKEKKQRMRFILEFITAAWVCSKIPMALPKTHSIKDTKFEADCSVCAAHVDNVLHLAKQSRLYRIKHNAFIDVSDVFCSHNTFLRTIQGSDSIIIDSGI